MSAEPDLVLPDGEPFSCYVMLQDDAPRFWTRCERNAQHYLTDDEVEMFGDFIIEHPRAIVRLYPAPVNGDIGVCVIHHGVIAECVTS